MERYKHDKRFKFSVTTSIFGGWMNPRYFIPRRLVNVKNYPGIYRFLKLVYSFYQYTETYSIHWIEWHDPMNWVDEKPTNIKDVDRIYKEGVQSIMDGLPNPVHTSTGEDGWIEVEATDYFEAYDIDEAKKIAMGEYECGSEHIFSVHDRYDHLVFTEEDCD